MRKPVFQRSSAGLSARRAARSGSRSANRSARQRYRRRLALALSLALGVALTVFVGGFFWFAGSLPDRPEAPGQRTDVVVVLTGGSGRLTEGLDLLAEGQAGKLFVSGVYRGVEVGELLSLARDAPQDLACCIVLGYDADDTRGNARETAQWMRENGYDSLRLVTAVYHMPRSLLEFRRRLPEAQIVSHPVFPDGFRQDDWWAWPGSFSLLLSEYVKWLAALVRGPADALSGD